jgi:hypothetical protein
MDIRFNKEINGKGLYATKDYKKGDIIHILSGKEYNYPTRETIHIGNNVHIYDEYGIYMNHSFNPTTYIDNNKVIALIDIKENDELNFNYNETEINMACPFYVNDKLVSGIEKN